MERRSKGRKAFRLADDLIERIENAVDACRGEPDLLDESTFATRWLTRGVRDLERRRNCGRRFPASPLRARKRKAAA